MQLSERVLSKRYARALYQSAAEKKEQDQVNADLSKAYRALLDKMPTLRHPRVSPAEKKALLARALGQSVSARVTRFLELLVDKKRIALLPSLAMDFGAIHDEERGVVNASVRSASELSEKDLEALKKRLGAMTGKKVNAEVKVAPELLAGVLVRMGDLVLDGTVRGKLQRMRRELEASA